MVGPMGFRMADEGGVGSRRDVDVRELALEIQVRGVGVMILAVEEPLLESEGPRELELLALHALLAPDGRGPARIIARDGDDDHAMPRAHRLNQHAARTDLRVVEVA